MPSPIIIFSTDRLRSGITHEVLKRIGFESVLVNSVLEARDAIGDNVPPVAILDTKGVFPDEINLLRDLCRTLRDTTVFVLGDRSIVDTFRGEGTQELLCLHDPLDPELIASKVKDFFSSKMRQKSVEYGILEFNLKQFLKLD